MSAGRTTAPGVAAVRLGPVALRVRRRAVVATLAVLLVLVGVLTVALLTGALALPVDRVLVALAGQGSGVEQLVVGRRLQRAAAAVVVGAALGCSGALTQTVTRNPIASPDILGVTAGASVFAVLVAVRPDVVEGALGVPPQSVVGVATVLGGLLTAALLLVLSQRGGFDGFRLVLVGIGVNALALAVVSWLLTRAELESAAVAQRWLVGSLEGATGTEVASLGLVALPGLLACVVLADRLGALRLGPEVARSLGVRAGGTQVGALVLAVVLASAATAVVGPVAFVAFVAPQIALRAFRTAGPPPLAGAAVGAALLLVADTLAQSLPVPLPVGVLTSLVGAPFLLYLATRSLRRTRG
ncbi:FecCD family ABC transporter permease [Krasilnikoviella flava]|uniref:Iron complex transport system permease protein n=1 Tax=Krasilnikoviella flava TaxID=526729 RepID=A0A1T5K2R3_9MICO|nr:iron chelate uptake ABC transporter family permease subunit [Krasilnikoviella flava]SKC57921.1 iron complex transport system permease protein [Krasilnikoviella flava]